MNSSTKEMMNTLLNGVLARMGNLHAQHALSMLTHNPKLTGERMNEVNEASPASETSDVERVVMRLSPQRKK